VDLARDLEPLLLGAVRVTVFLVLAPPFSHRGVPAAVKAMLGVGLALAMSPAAATASTSIAGFVAGLVGEAVVGGALAAIVAILFAAVSAAGRLLDLFGGFELGFAYDPLSQTSAGPFGQLYSLTATVLLFVSGGYQLVVAGLARSFTAVPLGVGLDMGAVAAGAGEALTQMFLAALQVAGPLIAVLFLADVGLGLLTRVSPALNAFALGFPLKILISLTLGTVAVTALPGMVTWLVDAAMTLLAQVLG
jgi:flagellar biosynthetic protein FliR